MKDYTTKAGMDVHARSITICAAVAETGEGFRATLNEPEPSDVASWLLALPQPVYCAYESGCTGFRLARELRAAGIDCDVIAVSTLPLSAKDRQQKCDKLDAAAILAAISNPQSRHTVVWVPDEATEAGRNLARLRERAAGDLRRMKQELSAFLLTHGMVWNEKTKSGRLRKAYTRAWWEWAGSLEFAEAADRAAFRRYVERVRWAEGELAAIERDIAEQAAGPENKPYVDALTLVNGIDAGAAYLIRVEFGDFERFPGGRKVTAWVGAVPRNGSSGPRDKHGPITRAGNGYLRRRAVEAVGTVASWRRVRKAPREGAAPSAECARMALDANARVAGRYRRLACDSGKHANKAKMAAAAELVRWA